ncbi:STAS domain-containing protein [Blastococcus saxobsidens]|uniref:Anti-sigma factor antagonist n=1 Tax=Blastococcus saxobsidens TaxID=138336 RepID=A0A4Q7Y6F1_9ACTN|nr:STAS domain-containing protein [Blastococcus saxobsidens]RZU32542.1 anti-sigma B factor antagonist [Blastococcus saxobsidens]
MTASSLDRPYTPEFADHGLVTLAVSGSAATPCLVATGEIDCTTAPHLQGRLEQLLDAGARSLVIDLTGVTFLDSAGLCALATVHRLSGGQVRIRVLAATRSVIRPMQITGLWDLLGGERVEQPTF